MSIEILYVVIPIAVLYALCVRFKALDYIAGIFTSVCEDQYWEFLSGEKGRGDERHT